MQNEPSAIVPRTAIGGGSPITPGKVVTYAKWAGMAALAVFAVIVVVFFGKIILKVGGGFYDAIASVFGGFVAFVDFLEDNIWLVWLGLGLAAFIPLAGYSWKAFSYMKAKFAGIKASGVTGKVLRGQLVTEKYNVRRSQAWVNSKGGVRDPAAYERRVQQAIVRRDRALNNLKMNAEQKAAVDKFAKNNKWQKWPIKR